MLLLECLRVEDEVVNFKGCILLDHGALTSVYDVVCQITNIDGQQWIGFDQAHVRPFEGDEAVADVFSVLF